MRTIIAGREETQLYLADKEADLLLGDAGSEVAQALLSEAQLEKLAKVREARRARLTAQAERRKQRQLTGVIEPAEPQMSLADELKPTATLPSPAATTDTEQSPEVLDDSLKQQENASHRQMAKMAASKSSGRASETKPPVKGMSPEVAKIAPLNMTALYGVLAEFTAETWLILRNDGPRFDRNDGKRRRVDPQITGNQVLDAALTKRPSSTKGELSETHGPEL